MKSPLVLVFLFSAAIASAQVPAGLDFRVNAYTTGDQIVPRITVMPSGTFVIGWTSDGQDGSMFGGFARRYDAAGVALGTEFLVNTYTTGQQGIPVPAAGRRGDFVIAWVEDGIRQIKVRRYGRSGNPAGLEFEVESYTTGSQYRPDVARSDAGFVVTWGSDSDGNALGIAAQPFDDAGNPIGPELMVNSYTTGPQLYPQVGTDPTGRFVVVWEDRANRDGSGSAIFGQRFDASGGRLGGEFQVNTYTTGTQGRPSVSVARDGGFVVAWTSLGGDGHFYGVSARRYSPNGSAIGNEFVANAYTTGFQRADSEAVAHDDQGNFVIVWNRSSLMLSGQRFDAAGNRRGVEFAVNSHTTGIFRLPTVAQDEVGNFVVAWEEYQGQDASGSGIVARRFGGLLPSALVVDSAGNGVLEPGESVDVRPSWRNMNGAAQTFSGTLATLSPSLVTLTDGTGSYGTVATGSVGPCTDCYGVQAANPVPRPAVHIDGAALESILPDVLGQQKSWTLHVGRSFSDVSPSSPFYRFIETLLHHGVTGGCTAAGYCPGFTTTRDQMAVFVLVAQEGASFSPPACTAPMFGDVPAASPFCRWVEELARRGVVSGCGGGNYCPASPVSREQMAVFVLLTLDPTINPPACSAPNMFLDVPETNPFCRWVEELATRGVVTGCGGGNYCPTLGVTREQMGVFISVTFGLTLYGG